MAEVKVVLQPHETLGSVDDELIKALSDREKHLHKEAYDLPVLENLAAIINERFKDRLEDMTDEILSTVAGEEIEKANKPGNHQKTPRGFSQRQGSMNNYTYTYTKKPTDYLKQGMAKKKAAPVRHQPVPARTTQPQQEEQPEALEPLAPYSHNAAFGKVKGRDSRYVVKLHDTQALDDLKKIAASIGMETHALSKFYAILFPNSKVNLHDIFSLKILKNPGLVWGLTKQSGHLVLFLEGDVKDALAAIHKKFQSIGQNHDRSDLLLSNKPEIERHRQHLDLFCKDGAVVILHEQGSFS